MQRILYYLLVTFLLVGCQNAALTELDYNTQQDFSRWQSWQWAEPAINFYTPVQISDLDSERIRNVVAEQFLQWGFLPSDKPDFLIRAWVGQEERVDRVYTQHGGYWGDPWGRWGGPGWVDAQDVRYRVFTLQLDILDATTGKLAWRASEQWPATSSATHPQKRDAEFRRAARRLLQNFPPQ